MSQDFLDTLIEQEEYEKANVLVSKFRKTAKSREELIKMILEWVKGAKEVEVARKALRIVGITNEDLLQFERDKKLPRKEVK